jgi:phosphoenolpyruvate carboxykinase (GTP)
MACQNKNVLTWIDGVAARLKPDQIVWINGSEEEGRQISDRLVSDGTFTPLNERSYPNCFLARSNPNDVARVEDRTFICSRSREDAGPTNNWRAPAEMYATLN